MKMENRMLECVCVWLMLNSKCICTYDTLSDYDDDDDGDWSLVFDECVAG